MTRARRQASRQAWLGALVAAVVGLAAWLSTVAISGLPWSSPYRLRLALPTGAPLLHAGDQVRIGGEPAGQVQAVTLTPRSRRLATATLDLDGGFQIGQGASARVRPLGLAGAVYVELTPGRVSRPLRSGALLTATGGVQVTDVISGFDTDARRAMTQVLTQYGSGVAGRGVALGQAIAGAPTLLRSTTAVLRALRPRAGALEQVIAGADSVTGTLAAAQVIPRLMDTAAGTLSATGDGAGQIRATVAALPALEGSAQSVFPEAGALLRRLTHVSTLLTPGVSALAAALPSMVSLERAAPALAGLGGLAASAVATLRALTPALGRLIGPASGLVPLSSPIAELASVLIPYRTELVQAPLGFTRWGNFRYDFGTGAGHRAVRFSMVLTCALARDPYPRPGVAARERRSCP